MRQQIVRFYRQSDRSTGQKIQRSVRDTLGHIFFPINLLSEVTLIETPRGEGNFLTKSVTEQCVRMSQCVPHWFDKYLWLLHNRFITWRVRIPFRSSVCSVESGWVQTHKFSLQNWPSSSVPWCFLHCSRTYNKKCPFCKIRDNGAKWRKLLACVFSWRTPKQQHAGIVCTICGSLHINSFRKITRGLHSLFGTPKACGGLPGLYCTFRSTILR